MAGTVHGLLERAARQTPERELLREREDSHSYAAIEARANAVAERLLEAGLARGDRVALLAKNSHVYVAGYYGILKAGGVAVPLNTASDASMLAYFLRDCGARMLLVGPKLERVVAKARGRLPALDLCMAPHADKLAVADNAVSWPTDGAASTGLRVEAGDLASIIYTSGSTGTPRGAMLTHGNICSNVAAIVQYLALTPADRVLCVLPFYYVYGKSLLNTHVAVGASVVIEERFQYPKVALDTLVAEQCTGLSGVPSTFTILLERTDFASRALPSLRYVTQAGGAMSPRTTRQLMAALPDKQIFIMYGATEASARLAFVPPRELATSVGAIGRPIDGVTLRVLRPDDSECDDDEIGELVASGPNIMQGYWNASEETALVLGVHGYRTGDLARRDARGCYYVVGRKKDMLKVGGHRLSAQEIEHAIAEHEAVSECAVLGKHDPLLGEALVAFVVVNRACDGDTLGASLRDRLPAYKIPRDWRIVAELPKNESGKIMKRELEKEL